MPIIRPLLSQKYQPLNRVELHLHLEGAIRVNTLAELVDRKKAHVNGYSKPDDLFEFLRMNSPASLFEVISRIRAYMHLINGDLEAIERIAFELCEDQSKDNVCYFEVRYAPQYLSSTSKYLDQAPLPLDHPNAVTPEMVVEAVNRGLKRGQSHFNIKARSILCCIRNFPESSWEVLELCTKYRSEGVVGIDIAGDEFHANSLHLFRDVFQEAKRRNIHRTCHASEVGPAVNVRIALEELEVERIGHGYHVVADVELYRQCVQQNIHFECCPLSSHFTNALKTLEHQDTHPIVMFARDRANFSINKDDPTVLQNTLGDEYEYLRKLGLNEAFIVAANLNAARSSFLSKEEKQELINHLASVHGFIDTN